ncbi:MULTISPECIES: ATP-binding protein [unclassified Cellulophaga]|uniref:ATP-binding protein n=1 Tax=unclassified Cellulophaga TaxID=2634405 RepID=UPI0026E37871|nr:MULTISPECIES: ATP-binding protein [unclassified Cellulophaga]MDO6490165.1 ATP-binding protein [Cellulophaga sp. 2_MG-2023]MDO6494641.1 ATP-binding protein [Cellulophaga sp. 3_MG-2023]
MKIKTIKIQNFRSYQNEVEIEFGDLTTFVGKNDIGKSTVLEALDIFFNCGKGVVKLDKDDVNKQALANGNKETIISVCFEELPTNIVIDSTNQTTLQNEYLLNSNNQLEIVKKYSNGGKEKVFVKANHPTGNNCKDLLLKKNTDLQKIIRDNSITCSNQTINAVMRTAIWQHYTSDLGLSEIEIDVTKGDTKSIWDKLQSYLPLYSLFQSDRKNSDGDSEVQDPLKEAVKQILNDSELKTKFDEIATEVKTKLQDVATRTLAKIQEMNPEIANSLNPIIPATESLKWTDVFKSVSIAGDEDIPINKRGSGVKRLILLNFFRAEVERRKVQENIPSVVYAIEEPETSQHTEHQKKLIKAFIDLSNTANTQVIITSHSASLVKALEFQHLRLVKSDNQTKSIENVLPNRLPYPSLNEVNYLAFSEITEEYHNELYGYIELEGEMNNYRNGKTTMPYNKFNRDGVSINVQNIILTDYIRHQIHHPENTNNTRFTPEQLRDSINLMRNFIETL